MLIGRHLPKFCPNCGTKLAFEDAKFCPDCGYSLTAETRPIESAEPHKEIKAQEELHTNVYDLGNRLEEVVENYGLSRLMDEVKEEEKLSIEDAKSYYEALKTDVEG